MIFLVCIFGFLAEAFGVLIILAPLGGFCLLILGITDGDAMCIIGGIIMLAICAPFVIDFVNLVILK